MNSQLLLLIAGRVNDVEEHGQEKITDQNGERSVDDRFSSGATDADRPLARGQSFVATDEDNKNAEAKRFRQTHDNVPTSGPAHHVRHVISAVHFQPENRAAIADPDA